MTLRFILRELIADPSVHMLVFGLLSTSRKPDSSIRSHLKVAVHALPRSRPIALAPHSMPRWRLPASVSLSATDGRDCLSVRSRRSGSLCGPLSSGTEGTVWWAVQTMPLMAAAAVVVIAALLLALCDPDAIYAVLDLMDGQTQ